MVIATVQYKIKLRKSPHPHHLTDWPRFLPAAAAWCCAAAAPPGKNPPGLPPAPAP